MTAEYPFNEGPYLSAALICEKVLVEKDDVKSAIRIVDRVIRQAVGPDPPAEMEPFDYVMVFFLRFKSGRARGVFTLELEPIKPSGERLKSSKLTVLFEGEEDRGVDTIGNLNIRFDQTGIYWFNVLLGGVRITRIPFRVIYIPRTITQAQA